MTKDDKITCKKPFGKKIKLDIDDINWALKLLGYNVDGYYTSNVTYEHEELIIDLEINESENKNEDDEHE